MQAIYKDKELWKIERLVITEGNFISNQASLNTYKDNNVEWYQYKARLDERTSPQCSALNGNIYKVEEAVAGENFPPMHPYCRSTTIAIFDKTEENKPIENTGDHKSLNKVQSNDLKIDKKSKIWYNKNSGGRKFTISELSDKSEKIAVDLYNKIKRNNTDISNIFKNVKHLGFSKEDINKIKSYIFTNRHWLTDLDNKPVYRLFDVDLNIAKAWDRLVSGKNIKKSDIVLLHHEKAEIDFIEKNKGKINKKEIQEKAHKYAKSIYNYDKALKEE